MGKTESSLENLNTAERIDFSKARLNDLKPPEPKPAAKAGERGRPTRRVVYDTKVPKLALRVTSAGTKTFYVVRRTGGTMTWLKLDPFPQMTVEQARKKAEQVLGEFAGGTNPAEAKRAVKGEWSFADAFDYFMSNKRNKKGAPIADKTRRDYDDVNRIHLPTIQKAKLSKISKDQIRALHTAITKKSLYQADKALAIICAVYNFAKDHEHFTGENPASRIQKNPTLDRDRFAKPHELPHLFEAIEQSTQRDFFYLALMTGARRSNLESMQWRDLDLSGGTWRIPMTKNGEPLEVPLVPEALAVLESRKKSAARGEQYVFPGTGDSGHLTDPKTAWARVRRVASFTLFIAAMVEAGALKPAERDVALALAVEALHLAERKYHALAKVAKVRPEDHSISDLRIHDLRRTFGSFQNMTGANLSVIGKSLGHKTQRATQIYARLNLDPVRKSVNTGTSAMLEAAGLKAPAEVVPFNKGAA